MGLGLNMIVISCNLAFFCAVGFAGSRQLTMKLELRVSEATAGLYQCEAYNPKTMQSILSQPASVSHLGKQYWKVTTVGAELFEIRHRASHRQILEASPTIFHLFDHIPHQNFLYLTMKPPPSIP